MSLFDVCRLCSSKNNLMWVFNRENKTDEKMEEVIFVTTGIEIHKKDMVSQKICDKCTHFTISILNFRKKCLENDKQLKDTCLQLLKDNDMRIPNTDVTIKHDKGTVADKPKQVPIKCLPKVHATVANLFRTYPGLKLPTPCLNKDFAPFVSMPLDEVEQYFEDRNLNFNEHVKYCFKSKKVGDKESASLSSGVGSAQSNFVINAEIISVEKEDEGNGIVRPIQIKIFPKDCADNRCDNNSVKKQNIALNRENANKICDKLLPMNRPKVPEHTRFYRRKHFSTVKESPNTENDRNAPAPLSYIEKSFELHICDICNSVHYNTKDLKKHQNKHLHCQFCKMKFSDLDGKLQHLKNMCIIKGTMENLPYVEMQKIEYNMKVRRKYPDAFTDFPALESELSVINNCNFKNLDTVNISASSTSTRKTGAKRHVTVEDTTEIIDISSDDDDVIPIMESDSTKTHTRNAIFGHSATRKSQVVSNSVAGVLSNNVPGGSDTVIKPEVKIKDNSVLNSIDPKMSDKEVLRKLLIGTPLKLCAETSTQTYFPKNTSIKIYSHELSAELHNLKSMLHSYIIPVAIKRGHFSVSYDYSKNSKGPKRLHLWNDLQPIDVKKRRFSTHLYPVETANGKSNTNSNNCIPISEPLRMENNVSTSLQSDRHKNSLVGDVATSLQAVTTASSIRPASSNSFDSSMVQQQDVNQCPSTAEPQAITAPRPLASSCLKSKIPAPRQDVCSSSSKSQTMHMFTNSSSSNIVILQQIISQSSSIPQPKELVAAPVPTSTYTSSSEAEKSASQQAIVDTPSPVLSYANSCVSNIAVPQQTDNYQHSASAKQLAINTTPIPAPSDTNSSTSNVINPQQIASHHPSIAQSQEVASTCTSSTDISPRQNVYQHFSTAEPEALSTATPSPVPSYKNSFVSNITDPQQAAYQYSSVPQSQNVIAPPIIASTPQTIITTSSPISYSNYSVSNITVSHQAVCRFSSTSKPQAVITTPSSALSSILNSPIPQQTVGQYSSLPLSQEVIATPISGSTCASSSATDISALQQDVHQYASNSVATLNPVSSCVNTYVSNITVPQEVSTVPVPTLSGTGSSEANISQQYVYPYSLTSKSKAIPSGPMVSSSTCASSSAVNLFGSQQYPPISKLQRVVPSTTNTNTSLPNISVPQQEVYQCPLTSSKPQQGLLSPITTCIIPSTSNISAQQQDVYTSTSKCQEVIVASTCALSSEPIVSAPLPQNFIRIKDMSELT